MFGGVRVFKYLLPVIILVGCSDIMNFDMVSEVEDDEPKLELMLELYMDLPMTNDGYYIFDYPNESPNTYTSVESISRPMERIFWSSDDFFCVEHMLQMFCEPIANYSTYTSSDGTSKRIVYVYPPHIGDTLSVYGCISNGEDTLCRDIYFIVTE